MRKVIYFLLITFFLPGTLWATDPIIGTWKLNVEKSKSPPVPPELKEMGVQGAPKESTANYREIEGELIEFTTKTIQADGSIRDSKWTWPQKGGKPIRYLPEPLPVEMSYVSTVLRPGEWIVTVMENNIQIGVMHKIISKDSKTMKITRFDRDSQGKIVEYKEIWNRQ